MVGLAVAGCATPTSGIDRSALMGAWTSGGPSFDFDIRESTILYEFDMQQHPYTIEGDTLVIDFRSVSLGVQKKLVVELTPDVLVLQDVEMEGGTEYRRVR
jgi:hypothetical protein